MAPFDHSLSFQNPCPPSASLTDIKSWQRWWGWACPFQLQEYQTDMGRCRFDKPLRGSGKCPWVVGGPAAVADALTHHSGAVEVALSGGWTYCSGGRTHPPGGGNPPPTAGGWPCTVGRVRFPHRYKPRSVLPPPAYSWNKCTGD